MDVIVIGSSIYYFFVYTAVHPHLDSDWTFFVVSDSQIIFFPPVKNTVLLKKKFALNFCISNDQNSHLIG